MPAPFVLRSTAKENRYGIQQHHLPAGVPAAGGHSVLYLPAEAAQRPASGVQPAVLRLGRTEVYSYHAVLHRVRLLQRSGHRLVPPEAAGEGRQGRADPVGGRESGHSGVLQVHGFRHQQHQRAAGHGDTGAGAAAAHRHLLLHLPDHELHHRRVPGTGAAPAEHHRLRRVCDAVPPADRRAHRAVQDGGLRSGAPAGESGRGQRGLAAAGDRPWQEGAHRQPDGRHLGGDRRHVRPHGGHGVAGRHRLYVPDLLRLLRLFGHGHRSGALLWVPFSGKLQLPLRVPLRHRILAAVAHQPVHVVPGVRLHPAGRQPQGQGAAAGQHRHRLAADRPVARGQLELCPMGRVLRRAAAAGKDVPAEVAG